MNLLLFAVRAIFSPDALSIEKKQIPAARIFTHALARKASPAQKLLVACGLAMFAAQLLAGSAAAQTVQFSGAQFTLGGGFSTPAGVAMDASGNVFVADAGNNLVKEIPAGCASSGCVIPLGGGFSAPSAVAVGNGKIYVADFGNKLVKEMTVSCVTSSCVNTLPGTYLGPSGVAVDGAGDVFVADGANGNDNAVFEIPAGCGNSGCVTAVAGAFVSPSGVAVDAAGNVYVADGGTGSDSLIQKIPAGCVTSELREPAGRRLRHALWRRGGCKRQRLRCRYRKQRSQENTCWLPNIQLCCQHWLWIQLTIRRGGGQQRQCLCWGQRQQRCG